MLKQQFKLLWKLFKQKPTQLTRNNLLMYLKHKNGFIKVVTVSQKYLKALNDKYLIITVTTVQKLANKANLIINKDGRLRLSIGLVQSFDSGVFLIFPRLLKFSTYGSLSSYLKHIDTLFDSQINNYNEPFAEILDGLQQNQFFFKNGKKSIVKYIAEKMLQAPSTSDGVKDLQNTKNRSTTDKSREVKVSVNRVVLGDLICDDHYNIQISLSRGLDIVDGDADSNFDSLNTDMQTKTVNFQIKYDLRNDMFFMAKGQNAIENLDLNPADFKEFDNNLNGQISALIKSRFIKAEEEQVKEVKIDYGEGIRIKKLANSANNVVSI